MSYFVLAFFPVLTSFTVFDANFLKPFKSKGPQIDNRCLTKAILASRTPRAPDKKTNYSHSCQILILATIILTATQKV